MKALDLQSEKYSPMGNVASEGVLNQLGRPRLDLLTVLMREAVQNSWDAKRADAEQVLFGVSLRTLNQSQQKALREVVFAETPGNLGLRELLVKGRAVRVLEIWDRGTSGLGGPTRADTAPYEGDAWDFVDFLRNVGHPPDKRLGGGTFGYGKASLYIASQVHTICVHTHAQQRGKPVQRFMAAALGRGYSLDGRGAKRAKYTGRHWWGREQDDEIVDPEKGTAADELAAALGMPAFAGREDFGTTILIVEPVLMERTELQALNVMKEALLWYCWPKMVARQGETPEMAFEVWYEGERVTMPSPRDAPPLHGFVQAMEILQRGEGAADNDPLAESYGIEAQRPQKHLGQMALVRFLAQEREEVDIGDENGVAPFEGAAHHVALMRQPGLVVKYVAGPALPTSMMEYAGVFVTDQEVDQVFAKAEPPTHDDWVHEFLDEPWHKTYIRVCYRRIDEKLLAFVTPDRVDGEPAEDAPLGGFAGALGRLLVGQEGPGAGKGVSRTRGVISDTEGGGAAGGREDSGINGSSGSGGDTTARGGGTGSAGTRTRRGRARVTVLDAGQMIEVGGEMVLVTRFVVTPAEGARATRVEARAGVVLDGNQLEDDPPAGGKQPRVVRWRDPEQRSHEAGPEASIEIAATDNGTWQVAVLVPQDVMVQLELTAQEMG